MEVPLVVSDVTLVELDTVMLSFSVPSSDTCQKKNPNNLFKVCL